MASPRSLGPTPAAWRAARSRPGRSGGPLIYIYIYIYICICLYMYYYDSIIQYSIKSRGKQFNSRKDRKLKGQRDGCTKYADIFRDTFTYEGFHSTFAESFSYQGTSVRVRATILVIAIVIRTIIIIIQIIVIVIQ